MMRSLVKCEGWIARSWMEDKSDTAYVTIVLKEDKAHRYDTETSELAINRYRDTSTRVGVVARSSSSSLHIVCGTVSTHMSHNTYTYDS